MRGLIVSLALSCALAAPALAMDWRSDLLEVARRWPAAAPQSEWPSAVDRPLDGRLVGGGGLERQGEGWSALDGWMRGDQLLRHWILHRFDINGDTWLSAPEAEAARRAFYAMADANGSGRITSEEFVVGWTKVRHELREFYALDVG